MSEEYKNVKSKELDSLSKEPEKAKNKYKN